MSNREIDALIHHDVMGAKRPPEGYRLANPIPAYSTDPAASKQLRDKLRADGWKYQITSYSAGFIAGFRKDENWLFLDAKADTEEMAVAIAALKAVGVQQEEE